MWLYLSRQPVNMEKRLSLLQQQTSVSRESGARALKYWDLALSGSCRHTAVRVCAFFLPCLCSEKQIVPQLHLPPRSASLEECRCHMKYHEWLTTVVKASMKSFHCIAHPHQCQRVPWEITDKAQPISLIHSQSIFHSIFLSLMPSLLHQGVSLSTAAFYLHFLTLIPAPCRLH